MLMSAISDNNSRLLSLLKASNHVVCDGPSLSVVETTLLKPLSVNETTTNYLCKKLFKYRYNKPIKKRNRSN